MSQEDRFLVLSEAAEDLELSVAEVRRLVEEGELEGHRDEPTGPLLITKESVDDYADEADDDADEDAFDRGYNEGHADGLAEADHQEDD